MPGSERPRILFINHWAQQLGGAEYSLLDILEETARRAEAFLVTGERGALVDQAAARGVSCIVIDCPPGLGAVRRGGLALSVLRQWRATLAFPEFVMRLRRCVRDFRPDLIHANVPKSHIALLLLSLTGIAAKRCFHMREIFDRGSAPYLLYALLFRRAGAQCNGKRG